ncbi:MAG: type II secretion system F family protein [Thermoplasmata archaeon]
MIDRIRKAYLWMEISPKDYILTRILPVFIFSTVFILSIVILQPAILQDMLYYLLFVAVPLFICIYVVIHPLVIYERLGKSIDEDMHLFVTRLGVLSVAYVSRKEMFDILGEMKEYRALAREVKKVYDLMSKWNIALQRACRLVAEMTPSVLFSDFLTRMAHAIETGESAEKFAENEQKATMEEFVVKYRASLGAVEIMNEVFISFAVVVIFIFVFVFILPFLVGENAIYLLAGAGLLFVLGEIFFLYFFATVVPGEHIWQTSGTETEREQKLKRALLYTALASGILILPSTFLYLFFAIPLYILVPLIFSPLALTGYLADKEEEIIIRRDENFPSFIRSLGSSAGAMGKETTYALKKLRQYRFGPLTKNIDDLYKRLNLRINKSLAWKLFGIESGSDLISKFNALYVEGTHIGGNPKQISQIISDNFLTIVGLRKHKYQVSATTSGILYGLTAGITFPLYISLYLSNWIQRLMNSVAPPEEYPFLNILHGTVFDTFWLTVICLFVVCVHSFLSAYMLKILKGSHPYVMLKHYCIMLWISGITAAISIYMMQMLLP